MKILVLTGRDKFDLIQASQLLTKGSLKIFLEGRRMEITGQAIWQALEKDPNFMTPLIAELKDVLQPYYEGKILEIISSDLTEKITPARLLEIKVRLAEAALENGLISQIAKTIEKDEIDSENTEKLVKEQYQKFIAFFKSRFELFLSFPEKNLYRYFEFNSANMKQALKGSLTIGDLLISQPRILIELIRRKG